MTFPAVDVRLDTPRLLLRPLAAADRDALFAIDSDVRVARYGSRPAWTSPDEAAAYLAKDAGQRADGEFLRFAIERREDGALVGVCMLFEHDAECRCAEVGYGLGPDVWGRGYAREAVGRLLDHGFGALDLNRIEADVDPRNVASQRLLERLGFRREGLLRERWIVAGEKSDSVIFGLLASEWPHPATA